MIDYRRLLKDALRAAGGDRNEATLLVEDALLSAEINADLIGDDIMTAVRRRGIRRDLDNYCRTSHGRLILSRIGVSVPAGKSVHRRSDEGAVLQLHLPYVDMEFDEIRDKLQEIARQRHTADYNIAAAARLLELELLVPGVSTPREALQRLHIEVQAWLSGARIMGGGIK